MVTARSRQAGTVADQIAQVPAEAPDYLPMWIAGSGLLMLLFFFFFRSKKSEYLSEVS